VRYMVTNGSRGNVTGERTPLMEACIKNDIEAVRDLLESGENPNAKNINGTTPLMYAKSTAVRNGDLTILELLAEHGADINARDNFDKTALMYLEEYSELVISWLKSRGGK